MVLATVLVVMALVSLRAVVHQAASGLATVFVVLAIVSLRAVVSVTVVSDTVEGGLFSVLVSVSLAAAVSFFFFWCVALGVCIFSFDDSTLVRCISLGSIFFLGHLSLFYFIS